MQRSLLLSIALGMATCTSSVLATVRIDIEPFFMQGHFYCSVNAPDNATVSLATKHVRIKGPGCDGHALHTTVEDLNWYAYAFERDSPMKAARIHVKVKGRNAKNLICQEDKGGRVEAPGNYCAQL